jgi:hypothetical protein
MPLLSYFVFVGSALIGLLYLASAVMPHDDAPVYISSQIDGVPAPRQPQRTPDEPILKLKPTTSFAAAPASRNVETPQQDIKTSTAAEDTPPPKKRKRTPRRHEGQEAFAQADDFRHNGRGWFGQRRSNDDWRDRGWRDRGWRDRGGWGDRGRRDRGWREPFWGWR